MSEALHTLEGWYVHHDFRTIDWKIWKKINTNEQQSALKGLHQQMKSWQEIEDEHEGSSGFFRILGHKADILLLHFRPTLEQLTEVETSFQQTTFADYTHRTYSYISVVELSNYVKTEQVDPERDAQIQRRLKPIIPDKKHICFYPMNKRREQSDNWYMLTMDQRREMMRSHGMIGRSYAGKVQQVIAGSIGFDDWEWGVTLFADDPVVYKHLIYEMRFDEVSARFSEFGNFLVGEKYSTDNINKMLYISK